MASDPKLISIFSTHDAGIAEMVRGLLEANGIRAMVISEGTTPLNFGSQLRGSEVYVAETNAAAAVALLESYEDKS
jgi:hypothetical protein